MFGLMNSRLQPLKRLLLNCIVPLSFYDLKRSIGEVLFLINFIGVNFEAGNETRENMSDLLLNKMKSKAKRVWFFVYISVF